MCDALRPAANRTHALPEIDMVRYGEMTGGSFNFCAVQGSRFARPGDGIGWYERNARRHGSLRADRPGRVETRRRYFWGTRG